MKKILIIFILGLYFFGVKHYFNPSTYNSCVRNLKYYRDASELVEKNKNYLLFYSIKPKDNYTLPYLTKKEVDKIILADKKYLKLAKLWDKNLVSKKNGIIIDDEWDSINFDLPDKRHCLCFLKSDTFNFTCASGQIHYHKKIEKYWYYVTYCPE